MLLRTWEAVLYELEFMSRVRDSEWELETGRLYCRKRLVNGQWSPQEKGVLGTKERERMD